MIIVFTSNTDGGIVQLAIQLVTELVKSNISCKCFIPENSVGTIPDEISFCVNRYKKFKAISQNDGRIKELSKTLAAIGPTLIWYVDSSILSSELCAYMARNSKRKYTQLLTIHDPAQDHPTNKITLREKIKRALVHKRRNDALDKSDKIVTLSPESGRQFEIIYPKYANKNMVFNLGAHIPNVKEKKPEECDVLNTPYFLFFGRIDKYKGVENLLRAFANRMDRQQSLVIAGKGTFSESEESLIKSTDNLTVLNRYIEDEEQIWLFKHAKALVLPYIEASQSGIIPIAYKFGIPVIVTNIPGLTQFVEDRRTGIICKSTQEITEALDSMGNYANDMKKACYDYYKNHLDWENSIRKMLESLKFKGEVVNE